MPRSALPLLLLTVALTGCPKTESTTTTDAAAAPVAKPDASAAKSDASAARPDAGGPSAQARAAVLHDLKEGRKLARAKDWPGAVKQFEHALTIAPDDVHVLADLGWAAFQANDLARAESANKRALANAKDPKVRAPILYNIGRVAEERGDKAAAAKAYAESLALRDNAEVKKRLASVGGAADAAMASLPCPQGFASVTELCACLAKHKDDLFTLDRDTVCKAAPSGLALGDVRLGVVEWGAEGLGEKVHFLTVKEGDRLRVVAELGRDYQPGAFGVNNTAEVKGAEKKTVGGHEIVVVRSEQHDSDSNLAGIELCTHEAKLETVCAFGPTPGSTKCTPAIPVETESGCGIGVEPEPSELDEETRKTVEEIRANAKTSRAKTTWSLANDGTVTVNVKEGSLDLLPPDVLRPHVLWR